MSPAKQGDSASSSEDSVPADSEGAPSVPNAGFDKKRLIWIAGGLLAVWAIAITSGSRVFQIIMAVVTLLVLGVVVWGYRLIKKQRSLISTLQGAQQSPEARRAALAKLEEGKDKSKPEMVFARAQLLAQDDPQAALKLLEKTDLKSFPAAMQDDVALLKAQIYLSMGRTQDARKCADVINLDNPERAQVRAMAATIVAEAWARTGKPKEALDLLTTVKPAKKDAEQLELQMRVVRVFAKFATNQRAQARTELVQLADEDLNQLGRFVLPQFRVHPELVKLARQVYEQHPAARKQKVAPRRGLG